MAATKSQRYSKIIRKNSRPDAASCIACGNYDAPIVIILVRTFIAQPLSRLADSRYFAIALNRNENIFFPVDVCVGGGRPFLCSAKKPAGD